MSITIGIAKEQQTGERRVALIPVHIATLCKNFPDIKVIIEKNAGQEAGYSDTAYTAAGARGGAASDVLKAEIVLGVTPREEITAKLGKQQTVIGLLDPFGQSVQLAKAAGKGVVALAMERIPRVSRAQSMDALSSQANIGGYRAMIEASYQFHGFFPLMMTAAGSSKPAKVIVLGAGVAGLQAIATARRLGAQIYAFDIRPEVREQIESLGARFIQLDIGEEGHAEGGYAKELSKEGQQRQQEALQKVLQDADVVVTTAQIPGKPAPVLVTENTVASMRPGSVVVDMAAASGGNCPLTKADKITEHNGVKLVGYTNYPAMMANDASRFYGKNLLNLLHLLLKHDNGKTTVQATSSDEILSAMQIKEEQK